MRQIKFRAWNIEDKKMYYDVQKTYDWHYDIPEESFGVLLDNEEYWRVMEYTGLNDKNNKEIFEGDIIKHSMNDDHEWGGLHEVKFNLGSFAIWGGNPTGFRGNSAFNYYPNNVEIVGNIYENPEILKGKDLCS